MSYVGWQKTIKYTLIGVMSVSVFTGSMPSAFAETVFFNSSIPRWSSNAALTLDNVRKSGAGLSLNDFYRLTYVFDARSKSFKLRSSQIYKNVGPYYNSMFTNDVINKNPQYRFGSLYYNTGYTYYFSSSKSKPATFVFDLENKHSLSYLIDNQSSDYRVVYRSSEEVSTFYGARYTGVISAPMPVFKSGRHTVSIYPVGANSMRFSIRFHNANNKSIATLRHGDFFSVNLENNVRDYGKFRVFVARGQTLRLSSGSSDIRISIVDGLGRRVDEVTGLPMIFVPRSSAIYNVFVHNQKAWGGSYSTRINVSTTVRAVEGNDVIGSDGENLNGIEFTPANTGSRR